MRRALLLLALSGCGVGKYEEYPANPYPDIETVAVLPVFNHSNQPAFDGEEAGNILASELLKFPGFRAVRPAALRASGEPPPRSVEDAVRLGRRLKVDAVLVAVVTDHDPYDPPRTSMAVQFLRTSNRVVSSADIDRLVQSSSWRKGPLEMSRDRAGHWIAAFEGVYDAHEERIRREVVQYAKAQQGSDTAFREEREFLAVQSRWLQFVSNQVLNRLIGMATPP